MTQKNRYGHSRAKWKGDAKHFNEHNWRDIKLVVYGNVECSLGHRVSTDD